MKKALLGILATSMAATPAHADDWTLTCQYSGGVLVEIKYYAGDSSHTVAVKAKGTSSLLETSAVPAARLTAPELYAFVVDRDRDGVQTNTALIIGLKTDTMVSSLEAGNGVSWDYANLNGSCAEQ